MHHNRALTWGTGILSMQQDNYHYELRGLQVTTGPLTSWLAKAIAVQSLLHEAKMQDKALRVLIRHEFAKRLQMV